MTRDTGELTTKSRRTTASKACVVIVCPSEAPFSLPHSQRLQASSKVVLFQHGRYNPVALLMVIRAVDAIAYTPGASHCSPGRFWVLGMARGLMHAGLTLFHNVGTSMSPHTSALHQAQLPLLFVWMAFFHPPHCSPGLVSSRISSLPSCPTPTPPHPENLSFGLMECFRCVLPHSMKDVSCGQ